MMLNDDFDSLFDDLEFEEKETHEVEDVKKDLDYEELLDSYNKLKFLYNYFEKINREIETGVILNISLDFLKGITDFDSCMIITKGENENDNLEVLIKREIPENEQDIIEYFSNEGLIEWCSNSFKMAVGYIESISKHTILAPIVANNRVIGFFAGLFNEEKDFSQKDLELQNVLFNQVAVLLDKLKLSDKLMKNEDTLEIRLQEKTTLYNNMRHNFNFIRRAGKTFEIDELYELIDEVFIPTFEVEKILILEHGKNGFSYLKSSGFIKEKIKDLDYNNDNSIIQYFINGGEPVNKFDIDNSFSNIQRIGIESDTMLGAPIIYANNLIGFVFLSSRIMNKPFKKNDVDLLNSMLYVVGYSIDIINYHKELVEKQRLQRDLKLASDIQKSLLPIKPPVCEKINFSSFFLPARMVGGDYFDFITRKDGRIIGLIADVSGKGIAASITMATIRSIIRTESLQPEFDLGNAMFRINNMICEDIYQGKFVTMFYFVIKPETSEVSLVSAGHNPLIYYDYINDRAEEIATGGIPVGLRENEQYSVRTMKLNKNDILFFYTDGLNEARNIDGEEFGMDRVHNVILENKEHTINDIVNKMSSEWNRFTKGAPQHDDTTLLAFKILEDEIKINIKDSSKVVIPSSLSEIKRIAGEIGSILRNRSISQEIIFDINLALMEILNNCCIHGNKSDEKKKITISYVFAESYFEAIIEDEGNGFEHINANFQSNPDRVRKRGIILVKALMDEFKYLGNGSKVYLKKYFKK